MVALVSGIVQLLLLIISAFLESNGADKAAKEKIIKELSDAIKNGDPSAITIILDGMR